MDERLNEFLTDFYDTISFGSAEDFDSLKFESMFSQSATLVELVGGELRSETILEYINRFLYEIRHYPELYSHGFGERQTGCEAVTSEDFVYVKSAYEKTYFDGEYKRVSGCNHMTLCRDGDWYKILFIAWKA